MIPILYDALEKDFTTNGIGFLTDAVSCIVTEERNGIYELALTYPTKGHLAKYLENDAIIKAKANDEDNPQLFRIYNHTKAVGENTTWYGEHISYELNGNPVDCFTVSEVNGERALHELLDAAILPHEFTCASDITTTNSTSIDGAVSVRNAMGGTEGSLLDVWGGEYHYDNYRVELLKARGVDNGVTIEYGKNLIDAKQEKNIADVVTVIFPYAKYTAEGAEQKTYITLPEKVLQHENANKYATLRCEIVDFSGEWESGTIITTDMLRAKAKEYLGKLSTEPKVNITLSFASLKKTKDYKNIKAFESVKLCDIVTVKILPLDINVKAKITKVKYDSIKEINGHVANPMIFAARSLNKCKLGIFSLNKLNNIINVCIILSVTLAVGTGFGIYLTGKSKIEAIVYVLIGYFFGMVLDMINRSTKISEKQTELTYILIDYLEDSVVVRENSHMEKPGNENIVQEKQSETSTNNKEFESDEQILNQVIGEFLQ